MTPIADYVRALEGYALRSGAHLVRGALPDCVHARVTDDLITLRTGLEPQEELTALVHELAHWLAHRHAVASPHSAVASPHSTVFEYEAEAVEALVMARLGLACTAAATDDLLSASVRRVTSTTNRILEALGL